MNAWHFTIKGPGITNFTLLDWCWEMGIESLYISYRYSDFQRVDLPNGDWDVRMIQIFVLSVYQPDHALMVKLRWGEFITDEEAV